MARKEELSKKQLYFCELYATHWEFFGNWVQSYIEAYKPDKTKKNWYNSARSTVSEILTNPNICAKINELLEAKGLNDEFVDKQLLFLISQHDEKSVKLWAIKEYNTLKARIEKWRQKALNDWDITENVLFYIPDNSR